MRKDAITSLLAVVVLTVLLGLAYPLVVTGIGQVTMPDRSNGSTIERGGKTVGSTLIGQDFRRPAKNPDGTEKKDADGGVGGDRIKIADPRYFQSRPSATGYSADATSFSNLGPNGKDTKEAIDGYVAAYLALEKPYDPGLTVAGIPVDAVTDSASGVDPGISQKNARIQARRVAAVRRLPLDRVLGAVDDHTAGRGLGVLGDPAVNVLELNLAIDRMSGPTAGAPAGRTGPPATPARTGTTTPTSTSTPTTEGAR